MLVTLKRAPRELKTLFGCSVVNMTGAGVMTSTFAIYLVTQLAFTPLVAGIILGGSSAAGALLSIPAGRLVDRLGPKVPLWLGNIAFGLLMLALVPLRTPTAIGVTLLISGACMSFNAPARSVYVVSFTKVGEGVVSSRSLLRVASTLGIGFGSMGGSLVIASGSIDAFLLAIIANGATSIATGIAMMALLPRLPGHRMERPHGSPRGKSAIDGKFILFSVLTSLLLCASFAMDSGLGVWMKRHSTAPTWLFPLFSAISAVLIIVFQSRVSGGIVDSNTARRSLIRGVAASAAALVIVPVSAAFGPATSSFTLILGILMHVAGEMLSIAGVWELSYSLRPDDRQGAYQGVETAISGSVAVVAPPVVLWLCLDAHPWGWSALAALSILLSFVAVVMVRPTSTQ